VLLYFLQRLRVLERRKGASAAGDRRHEMDLVNQVRRKRINIHVF
jgi:hypothetical protein